LNIGVTQSAKLRDYFGGRKGGGKCEVKGTDEIRTDRVSVKVKDTLLAALCYEY